MNKDFELRIEPAALDLEEDQLLQLVVHGTGFPNHGRPLDIPRSYSVLETEQLEQLLRGELIEGDQDEFFATVRDKVSDWLMDSDLKPLFGYVYDNLRDNEKLRLVFSVDERIRSTFDITEVPIELLRVEGEENSLCLSQKCAAILHAQDKQSLAKGNNYNWPLRVLFVRSNPTDLGEVVPEAAEMVNNIVLNLAGPLGGESAVQVDVLSSESPNLLPPTLENLNKQLRREDRKPYHILVYLGHCSLKKVGQKSIGYLQLENEDDEGHEDISPEKFVTPLANNPVPVVLLVGCMTATKLPELKPKKRQNIEEKIPNWVRGSQNVAQALISSVSTGVRVVVGMRYRLYSDDATTFIKSFFENLLTHETQKGDVEAAVHFARQMLQQGSHYLGTYSAPVVFRASRTQGSGTAEWDEPLFPFLKKAPPAPTSNEEIVGNWGTCVVLWNDLQSLSWSKRSNDSKLSVLKALADIEKVHFSEAAARTSFVIAERVIAEPPELAFLQVRLYGSAKLKRLQGILFPDSHEMVFKTAQPYVDLTNRGFKVLLDVKSNEITYDIRAPQNQDITEGPLFEVKIQLGSSVGVRYRISTGKIETDPPSRINPGVNVLIVPPP